MTSELASKIGSQIAFSILLDTVLSFARNENQDVRQSGSVFTYTSVFPKGGSKKDARLMDDNLKIVLAITANELKNMVGKSKVPEWTDVVSTMRQNIMFSKCEDTSKYGIRTYSRDSFDFCKFNGDPDEKTVQDVREWFVELLDDIDPELKSLVGVLQNDTFTMLANIVASTGSHVSSISTAIRRSDHEEFTLADIGLVRYPSYANPKVKIFRLKLKSWRHCQRILAFESNKNGLTAEVDSQEYAPREDVIKRMRETVLSDDDVKSLCETTDRIVFDL
jgi:hypothetical protein